MNDNQLKWRTTIPSSYQNNYTKAIDTNSKKEAIKAKCLDCMNFSKDDIKNCEVDCCPLHPHRPYKKKDKNI